MINTNIIGLSGQNILFIVMMFVMMRNALIIARGLEE
jgi:hypothetical protein